MAEQVKDHLSVYDVFPDPDFQLTVLRREPQIPFPAHTHDFSELVIIYGGSGIHFTSGNEYSIHRGDVFVLNGDRAHGYKKPAGLRLLNIIFDRRILPVTGFFAEELDRINGYHALFTWEPRLRDEHSFSSRLRLPEPELAAALDFTDELERELNRRQPGYRAAAMTVFIRLCVYLGRQYDAGTMPGMKEMSRISGILSYLEQNTTRFITISELTDFAGMSESTMLRLFHRVTGKSPIEYHNSLRIKEVCRLLSTTDKTITEAAYDTGFSDSNYLCRLFRKVTGTSPGKWRKDSITEFPE